MENKKYAIVGAGISGLTIANELLQSRIDKDDIIVFEANDYVGGLIKTDYVQGYLTEWGPEGLRGKSDQTKRIFELIEGDGIPVSEESKLRYIGRDDDLIKVPTGPLSAIFTKLIPFFGKLRLLKEPFVTKNEDDETVAGFVERRLGKHIVPLVDAFVTGVFGGDPHQLSVKHAFPALKEIEVEYGSLIRGGRKYSKKKKEEKKEEMGEEDVDKEEDEKKPPFLLTHENGMQGIVEELAENVDVHLSEPVGQISHQDDGYELTTSKEKYHAQNLVIATGVNALHNINFDNFEELDDIPQVEEAKVTVVTLGFNEDAFETPVEGYGFLIPDTEGRFIMGSLFSSRLFDFRAPDGKVMLRCFVGGYRHPDRLELDDDEIIDNILADLDDYLGVKEEPEFTYFQSHDSRGIPQLQLGHDTVIEWREKMEQTYSNLKFGGIGWSAISCDKLISESRMIAKDML